MSNQTRTAADGLKLRLDWPFAPGMTPLLYDLFGEIPVTLEEIEIWMDVVPALPRDSWRRAHYAAGWNVAEKVRSWKAAGRWGEIETARSDQLRGIGLTSWPWP
jgi:hypothetical protein